MNKPQNFSNIFKKETPSTFYYLVNKYNKYHDPRTGRFTYAPGGAGGGAATSAGGSAKQPLGTKEISKICSDTITNMGGSFDPFTGKAITSGVSVADAPENEYVFKPEDRSDFRESFNQVKQYYKDHVDYFGQNPGRIMGTWIDSTDGSWYLDTPQIFESRRDGIIAGIKANQLAVFDIGKLEEIRLEGCYINENGDPVDPGGNIMKGKKSMNEKIHVGSWGKDGLDALLQMSDEECRQMADEFMQVLIDKGIMSLDENDKIIWHGVKK